MPGLVEVILRFIATVLAAYLVGAIPNGVLVGKLFGDVDVRAFGSGKTGATNVLRTLGPGAAALVVVGDIAKGAIAVLLARYLFFGTLAPFPMHAGVSHATLDLCRPWAEALAALAAVLGHTYSVYIKFTGGRGVLTGAGALVVISPLATLIGLIAGIVPIALTRYVSLGSILGAAVVPLVQLVLVVSGRAPLPSLLYALLGAVYIIALHRDNIERLLQGTERKLGERAASQMPPA
jgi:acyl phosphate:glycerol-3-phosphate acyltransferase